MFISSFLVLYNIPFYWFVYLFENLTLVSHLGVSEEQVINNDQQNNFILCCFIWTFFPI